MFIHDVIRKFSHVSMDTEFLGCIYYISTGLKNPTFGVSNHYCLLKANVDALKLFQVSLIVSHCDSNLPNFGMNFCYIWELNFCDFDVACDLYESIELLRRQGIDFVKNWIFWVSSIHFAHLMVQSGLPRTLEEFLEMLRLILRSKVYDVKHLMEFCDSLYGGLEHVKKHLEQREQSNNVIKSVHIAYSLGKPSKR